MPGGPRIRHLDDFSWQEVRRQQHGDRTASVREKWLDFSPRFLSLYADWDPGMIVQPHGHNSDHVVFVVAGEMTCGDVRCPAGTHLALDQGDTFGPFVAGPETETRPRSILTSRRCWLSSRVRSGLISPLKPAAGPWSVSTPV